MTFPSPSLHSGEAPSAEAIHPPDSPKSYRRFFWKKIQPVTFFLLLLLYLTGVWIRTESFYARGHQHEDQFWVESAQHFRNVRMVAEGGTIPELDIDLEYPDGLQTRSHTIHGEQAIGLMARNIPFEKISKFAASRTLFGIYLDKWLDPFWPVHSPSLSAFVRYFVRLSICTLIFWIYLATREITGNRWAGWAAAILYTFSFGGISRSLGDTFYHEHVALPLLGIHFWLFFRTLKRESLPSTILSVVFLLGALLTWKVIEFYFLVLILYFFLLFLGPGLNRTTWRLLILITCGVLVVSLFFNVHLRYNQFYLSKGMLGAYGILIAGFLQKRFGERWKWSVIFCIGILLILKTTLLPDMDKYGHVWQTFFYRFRYLHKPLDPSLLPFDVRHYWVPPYVSPSLFSFLNEVFWPVILAIPAILGFLGYLILPSGWKSKPWSPEKNSYAFLFVGFFCFLLFYLLFYKIKTFLLLFSLPWVGILWQNGKGRSLRIRVVLGVLLCFLAFAGVLYQAKGASWGWGLGIPLILICGAAIRYRRWIPQVVGLALLVFFAAFSQGYQTVAWNQSWLAKSMFSIGLHPSQEKNLSNVLPGREIQDVVDWAKNVSEKDKAFLCEFVMSPSILTYADRPINQHCFFESAMRQKYHEFSDVLFKSEDEFYQFCQKYKTTYFVYNAHMLLRDDPNMSFRYITNNMGWDTNWAAYRFHFQPEKLKHFKLVHQSFFIRIYQVLEPGQSPGTENQNQPYSPLYDEDLFEQVISWKESPSGSKTPDAAAFLYPAVDAFSRYYRAEGYLQNRDPQSMTAALVELTLAERDCPWASPVTDLLGEIYMQLNRPVPAQQAFEKSLLWRPNDPIAKRQLQQLLQSQRRP